MIWLKFNKITVNLSTDSVCFIPIDIISLSHQPLSVVSYTPLTRRLSADYPPSQRLVTCLAPPRHCKLCYSGWYLLRCAQCAVCAYNTTYVQCPTFAVRHRHEWTFPWPPCSLNDDILKLHHFLKIFSMTLSEWKYFYVIRLRDGSRIFLS